MYILVLFYFYGNLALWNTLTVGAHRKQGKREELICDRGPRSQTSNRVHGGYMVCSVDF